MPFFMFFFFGSLLVALLSISLYDFSIHRSFVKLVCPKKLVNKVELIHEIELLKLHLQTIADEKQVLLNELEYVRTMNYKSAKKYFNHDLHKVFGVEYVTQNTIHPSSVAILSEYKLKYSDWGYPNSEEIDNYLKIVNHYLAADFNRTILEQQYYIRYSDDKRGFGIFAAYDLTPGIVLDEYLGEIVDSDLLESTDYMWDYPLELESENAIIALTFGMNSLHRGNAMRFVNHSKYPNSKALYIPFNNSWHIFYFVTKFIPQDTQIFVNYGDVYWKGRENPS